MQPDEFLREVDENLRYERMETLWKTYKIHFFVSIALLFAGVAGFEYYKEYTHNQLQEQAKTYWQAASLVGEEKVKTLEPLMMNGSKGFQVLAAIRAADDLVKDSKPEAAYAMLEAVKTAQQDQKPVVRDILTLYQAQVLLVDSDQLPENAKEQADALLKNLVESNSPYMPMALLRLGERAEDVGDKAKAVGYYERILDMYTAPAGLKEEVQKRIAQVKFSS